MKGDSGQRISPILEADFGTSKRRKKAQPRKLQITSENNESEVEKNSQDCSKMKKKRKSSKSAKKNTEPITKLVLNSYDAENTLTTGNNTGVQTGFSCSICRPSVMFQTNEDRGKHMSEYHPYSLDIDFGTDSTINCPLCEDESFSNSTEGRQKYNQHIEDIHMTWIAPENSSSSLANENSDDKTTSQSENKEIPIIPFSSVILLEAENSNELEPWRRKFGKDCNKVAATGSRPLKCPICPSFFTKLSISEFKSHMIRGK